MLWASFGKLRSFDKLRMSGLTRPAARSPHHLNAEAPLRLEGRLSWCAFRLPVSRWLRVRPLVPCGPYGVSVASNREKTR